MVNYNTNISAFNVVTGYGADPSGTADSTTAIQNAINAAAGKNIVFFPAGTYKISSALVLASGVTLLGSGRNNTTINQVSTTAAGLSGVTLSRVTVRDLTVQGPGSGSGIGLNFTTTGTSPVTYLDISDVTILHFGSHGLYADTPIVSRFSGVISQQNGGDGFHLTSTATVGTSCVLTGCYANANTGNFGYSLTNMQYSMLSGCAADSQTTDGYQFSACHAVTAAGCGCENAGFNAFEWTGGSGNVGDGLWVLGNNNFAFHATGSEVNLSLTGCSENSPAGGAVASIKTETGTSAVVTSPTVATAVSYAAGTAYLVSSPAAGLTVATGPATVTDGSTKEYRLRTSGGSLDFEGSGADLILSVWSAFGFGGTQHNYARFTSGAQALILVGKTNFVVSDPFGATVLSIDPATGTTGQVTAGQLVCATGNAISQGSGAPSKPNGVNPAAGDIWFRTDTPSTANQRIYICTVGGATPTWVALAV